MDKKFKFVGVNSIKFNRQFKEDADCYQYLALIKWSDETYECKRCKYPKYYLGKKPFSRRCLKCKHDESPTAGTMFDKVKFPLLKGFSYCF